MLDVLNNISTFENMFQNTRIFVTQFLSIFYNNNNRFGRYFPIPIFF